jgi:hypothetical protein
LVLVAPPLKGRPSATILRYLVTTRWIISLRKKLGRFPGDAWTEPAFLLLIKQDFCPLLVKLFLHIFTKLDQGFFAPVDVLAYFIDLGLETELLVFLFLLNCFHIPNMSFFLLLAFDPFLVKPLPVVKKWPHMSSTLFYR